MSRGHLMRFPPRQDHRRAGLGGLARVLSVMLCLSWGLTGACGAGTPPDDGGSATRQTVAATPTGGVTIDRAIAMVWQSDGAPRRPRLPTGLALDRHGQIYVADSGNARIQKFDRAGRFPHAWGGRGTSPGEFAGEVFLAVDERDYVFAADTFNHRVQVFTSQGLFLAEWGGLGMGPGQFAYAGGIAVDRQGDIYSVDIVNGRVQRFRWRAPAPVAPLITPTLRPAPPSPPPMTAPWMTPTAR